MIKKMKKVYSLPTLVMKDEFVAELLYRSFKLQNEQRFRKTEPEINLKHTNKMVSQKYQNVSMKRRINKSAYICGKVKY